jgi:hypothetical protein
VQASAREPQARVQQARVQQQVPAPVPVREQQRLL